MRIVLPRSRSLLLVPFFMYSLPKNKNKKTKISSAITVKNRGYEVRKSSTASHHALSFMHSSKLRPFPSPTSLHLRKCTAFCVSPHAHEYSCDLPITHSHLRMGPLSVTAYVKPFTAFLDHARCPGPLWIG